MNYIKPVTTESLLPTTGVQAALKANRWVGYTFAALTGASIGFSRTGHALGRYEQIVATFGLLFLALTVIFVSLSTDNTDRRAKRILRCGIIMTFAIMFTAVVKLDVPVPLISQVIKLEFVDLFAVFFALVTAGFAWLALASAEAKMPAIPAALAAVLNFAFACVAFYVH
jgi:hypothetical protein